MLKIKNTNSPHLHIKIAPPPENVRKALKGLVESIRAVVLLPIVGLDHFVNESSVSWKNFCSKPLFTFEASTLKTSSRFLHVISEPEILGEWKMKLIKEAKHSLEIAGYCGGKPFKEALKVIDEKIKDNPKFKVRILSNINLINTEEKITIKRLMKKYPSNFEVVEIKAVWGLSPKLLRSENHTKMVVADQKYFVVGGSGIANHLLKHGEVKREGGKGAALADGQADIDLLGEGEAATILKKQFDGVWEKWKTLGRQSKNSVLDKGYDFTHACDKIVLEIPAGGPQNLAIDLLMSHPEQYKQNLGEKKYVEMIRGAKNSISVSNMVFNREKIIKELRQAVRRGVNVTVLTNGDFADSAFGAKSIACRNRLHYKKLLRSGRERNAGQIQVFEYKKKDVLLHTKVMVIDHDSVHAESIVGSFNISKESARCDDELLFVIRSQEIAKSIQLKIDSLKKDSKEIEYLHLRTHSFRFSYVKGWISENLAKGVIN